MKLINDRLPIDLEWEENEFLTLVVEDSKLMSILACDFIKTIDENNWIISENGKMVDFAKVDVIFNPFSVSLNQRKLLNKLYEISEFNIKSSSLLFEWNTLQENIIEFVENLKDNFDYDLQYTNKVDIKDVLKLTELKFNESGTIIEKLLDYLVLANDILKVKLFVFFNLKTYLNLDEINYIFEQAQYHKFNILFIERFDVFEKIEGEKIVVIDVDKCVIIK